MESQVEEIKKKSLTTTFSLLQFLYYFNFFWLIQNVFFLQNGINYKQLSILLGIWSLSIILFEIPSGILADKFGSKRVIIFGKLCNLIGLLFFIVKPTFENFIIGMIFWGLHDSFVSGSQESLVYDYLKSIKRNQHYKKVMSIATMSREVGLGCGVLIAGYITKININYNLYCSIAIAFLGIIVAMYLPKIRKNSISDESKLLKYFNSSIITIKNDINLINIGLFTIFSLTLYQVISEYFVVSLTKINLDYRIIGILAFLEMVFFAVGTQLSQKIKETESKFYYPLLILLMSIGVVIIASGSTFFVILGWMYIRVIKAIAEIVSNTDWQHRIDSSNRATTTSIKGFMGNIIYVPIAFIFGSLADGHGLFNSFYFISILMSIYLIWNLIYRKLLTTRVLE